VLLRDYSAQRLSASSEFLHHPRCNQTSRQQVLNAFRHHRNSHSRFRVNVFDQRNGCSTPLGIIGILT